MGFWGRLFGPPDPPATCPTCAILRDEHRRREGTITEAAERRERAFLDEIRDLTTKLAAIADRTAAATAAAIGRTASGEPARQKPEHFRLPPMIQNMPGHTSMAEFRRAAKPQDKRKDLPPPAVS